AVVGRENDLSNILDLLSNCNQESYSVVRITGMGGIGKTTLAQLVYADNMDHFQIKIWQILNLSLLRVLILSRIGIEELPRSICNLKHLRHLDLTSNPIISFPRSFSKLYNLQVLKLKECHRLERFPTNMRKLINLEYFMFNNRANKLTQMPRGRSTSTSSFSCLETLEISGCPKLSTTPTRFPSLKNLSFEIQLLDDQSLKFLPLKLLSGANSVLQALLVSDCDAFQGFLPDDEQQHQHYQPDHLSNDYLSKIEILKCPSLTVLPADFSGLNSLTYLAIEGCGSLQSLPVGIEILPALHTLIIGGFSEDLESFPFPTATASYGERYFATLRDLKIRGWRTLKVVLPDQLQHVTSLYHLSIRDFPCLLSLPEWFGKLSSLQTLDIENCSRLEYLPSEEQMLRLTSLQIINIRYSPLLLERCRFPNEEWHKIAHLKQVSENDYLANYFHPFTLSIEYSVSTSSPSLLDHIPRNADMNEELETRRRSGIFSNQNKEASPNKTPMLARN
ncbi:hypothetical protein C5167_040802, partial [Papaver somniferum]